LPNELARHQHADGSTLNPSDGRRLLTLAFATQKGVKSYGRS
jgi:hypothetical protein